MVIVKCGVFDNKPVWWLITLEEVVHIIPIGYEIDRIVKPLGRSSPYYSYWI